MIRKLTDFVMSDTEEDAVAQKTIKERDYPGLDSLSAYLNFRGDEKLRSKLEGDAVILAPTDAPNWGGRIVSVFDQLKFYLPRHQQHLTAIPDKPIPLLGVDLIRWDLYLNESEGRDGKITRIFTDELTVAVSVSDSIQFKTAFWTWIPTETR